MRRYTSTSGQAVFKGSIGWKECTFTFKMWYKPVRGQSADYGIKGTGTGTINDFVSIKGLAFKPTKFE